MPYCSGCGSRYQEGDTVCKSCGYEIEVEAGGTSKSPPATEKKARTAGVGKKTPSKKKTESAPKPEAGAIPPVKSKVTPTEIPSETPALKPAVADRRQLQSENIMHPASFNDIHLGKGIIKPKAVEVGVDGYHFKYEDQPQTSKKADNWIKEQSKEYRVINPEFEPEPATHGVPEFEAESIPVEVAETISGVNLAESQMSKGQDLTPKSTVQISKPVEGLPEAKNVEESLEALLQEAIEAEMRDLGLLEDSGLEELNQIEDLQPINQAAEPNAEEKAETALSGDGTGPQSVEPSEINLGEAGLIKESAEGGIAERFTLTGMIAADTGMEVSELSSDPASESTEPRPEIPNLEPLSQTASDLGIPKEQTEWLSSQKESPSHRESPAAILWEGRQSWFGIPLPNQVHITEQALILSEQSGRQVTIELGKIKQITVKQSWLTKFLGIGDLIIDLKHQVPSRQTLSGIANPVKVRALLEERIKSTL